MRTALVEDGLGDLLVLSDRSLRERFLLGRRVVLDILDGLVSWFSWGVSLTSLVVLAGEHALFAGRVLARVKNVAVFTNDVYSWHLWLEAHL